MQHLYSLPSGALSHRTGIEAVKGNYEPVYLHLAAVVACFSVCFPPMLRVRRGRDGPAARALCLLQSPHWLSLPVWLQLAG